MSWQLLVLALAGFLAGAQNAVAGGGSFLTFPALLFAGLDPRAANITSTIALFPGQATTGWTGRHMAGGAAGLSLRTLFTVSVIGGAIGAILLLATPVSVFTHLVPWLIAFATIVFIWGSFFRKPRSEDEAPPISPRMGVVMQFIIAIYGGYFGGGIGILMMAALTAVGLAVRHAGATKNVLAGVVNVAAVVIFLVESKQNWLLVGVLAVTAIIGGQVGVLILRHVPEKVLRVVVSLIGIALTIGMFLKA
ncbi:sulfite exporter TauE/SafE family protein [Acidocella facilis]|uniref:sulfite exporter TauE/SafE family protein n=1 Tax=Acidocella facilis TaxID=525 RepID=UPI001F3966A4|nr:sulfite exporter TauE/SafE family protein [Acidocella facilis]